MFHSMEITSGLRQTITTEYNLKQIFIAHLSRSWSIGWVALSFLVRLLSVRPAMVTSDQISTFFNIYNINRPFTNPVPINTKQYQVLMIQYHQVPTRTAPYWPSHQVLASTAFCWPSTIMYQPVLLHTDSIPPSTNPNRPLLTQYHQVPTSTAFYRPSTTKHWPTDLYWARSNACACIAYITI